jgi:hypothetical protein
MSDPDPNPDPESVPVPLTQKISAGPVPQHCYLYLIWAVFLVGIRMDACIDLALLVQDFKKCFSTYLD